MEEEKNRTKINTFEFLYNLLIAPRFRDIKRLEEENKKLVEENKKLKLDMALIADVAAPYEKGK